MFTINHFYTRFKKVVFAGHRRKWASAEIFVRGSKPKKAPLRKKDPPIEKKPLYSREKKTSNLDYYSRESSAYPSPLTGAHEFE